MNRLSIRLKLLMAFMVLVVFVGGMSYYQVRSIQQLHGTFSDLARQDFDRVGKLEQMRLTALGMEHLALKHLDGQELSSTSAKAAQQVLAGQLKDAIDQCRQLLVDPEDKRRLTAQLTEIAADADAMIKQMDVFMGGRAADVGADKLLAQYTALETQRAALEDDVNQALQIEQQSIKTERVAVEATIAQTLRSVQMLALLVTLGAIVIGLFVATILIRSIVRVKEGADRIASGDFSRPITINSRDEMGRLAASFNQMAERLRDSYNRLALQRQRDETLLESMSEGLIAVDNKGQIVVVNNQAVELLDLGDRDNLQGKPVDSVLHLNDQNDQPLTSDQYPAHRVVGKTQAMSEVYALHKGDKKLFINITVGPVVVDGAAAGVIMVARDVTREKEVDRMKTEFISLASHQLRTPLSAIRWFIEMLLSGDAGKLTVDQTEFAQNVADSTERMTDLVNSLLNISRIESGRIMIDPKPTDLSELINGIVNDLKAKITQRQQHLVVSVHKELPRVSLDPKLIGQVFLNLLTNAIKYTPKGGEIAVFVSRKGDELVSQVTDNGYGIPKTEQTKMFQKFFRASNVAKFETDGTGLGLYLIKAIIESSGGRIWFESQEGKGTTFWFSLPMSGMKPKEGEVTLDG